MGEISMPLAPRWTGQREDLLKAAWVMEQLMGLIKDPDDKAPARSQSKSKKKR